MITAMQELVRWLAVLVPFLLGIAAGSLPALLAVLWGVITLRRGLRRPTIE